MIIFESLSYDKILKYYTENIILTINSYNDFLIYQSTKMKIRTHLQVDTGMNRIGFSCLDDVKKIIELCPPNILIEGISDCKNLLNIPTNTYLLLLLFKVSI